MLIHALRMYPLHEMIFVDNIMVLPYYKIL